MNNFDAMYYFLWAIFAILIGLVSLIFRERLLKFQAKVFYFFYKKTNLEVFKYAEKKMDSIEQRMVTTIVAIILIISGIYLLIQNI